MLTLYYIYFIICDTMKKDDCFYRQPIINLRSSVDATILVVLSGVDVSEEC